MRTPLCLSVALAFVCGEAFAQTELTSAMTEKYGAELGSVEYRIPSDSNRDSEDLRLYKKKGAEFPWKFKCTTSDYRTVHGCFEVRFFDPSARVYFDSGADDENELDLFNDGKLNATVDFASLYVPWRFGRAEFFDDWSWGPMVGVGISAPAQDSQDGSSKASGSPVVMLSYGVMVEYKPNAESASFGLELGRATGFSSNEGLSDDDDSATYVGLKINIPTSKRKD